MKLPRRKFLYLTAVAAALPAVSRFAFAQAYPSRPVRIVVGFAPGGAFDIMARLIGQWLSERLGHPTGELSAFSSLVSIGVVGTAWPPLARSEPTRMPSAGSS
jgi:hypothetical protein